MHIGDLVHHRDKEVDARFQNLGKLAKPFDDERSSLGNDSNALLREVE
jgi:hypothetical protein